MMRMFSLCLFISLNMAIPAQADTAIEVFKREFIERYVETFYRGEPFDFEGLNCEKNPAVDEATSCVNAKGLAGINVRNIDPQEQGSPAKYSAIAMVVNDTPVLPEFDWSVRSSSDMDEMLDEIADWAKSKPETIIADLCPKPKDYDSHGLKGSSKDYLSRCFSHGGAWLSDWRYVFD